MTNETNGQTLTTAQQLEQLLAKKAELTAAFKVATPETEEALMNELFSVKTSVSNLEKKLNAEKLEAEIAEKRNAAISAANDRINAIVAAINAASAKGATDEAKNAASELRDAMVNDLLKLAGVTTSKPQHQRENTGERKPGTQAAIRQLVEEKYAAGVSLTQIGHEIREMGYSRGTTGSVITAFKKENGIA